MESLLSEEPVVFRGSLERSNHRMKILHHSVVGSRHSRRFSFSGRVVEDAEAWGWSPDSALFAQHARSLALSPQHHINVSVVAETGRLEVQGHPRL